MNELPALIPSASGAVIELVDDHEMVYSAASGAFERFVGLRLNPKSSLSGLCVKERKPLYARRWIDDLLPAARRRR